MKILNLGSGQDASLPGAVCVDFNPETRPDIVHDLNKTPWLLESNAFDAIYCRDVLEHLNDLVPVMEEIHRVGRKGGTVTITTPHYSCANSYTDPTHRHHLGLFSLDYFTGENQWGFYSKVRFKKTKVFLHFYPNLKNKIIWRIANRWPRFYEEHLAWIFPAWFMSFELEIIKE